MHQYIPKELQISNGFAIPIASWLNNHLKEYVQYYINKKIMSSIFQWDFILKFKSDFYREKNMIQNYGIFNVSNVV